MGGRLRAFVALEGGTTFCSWMQSALDAPAKFPAMGLKPQTSSPLLRTFGLTSNVGSLPRPESTSPLPGFSLLSDPLFAQAVCGYGSQEVLPLRAAREGELYFPEDREVNLVELALATNIPKGCAETAVRGDCWGPAWGGDKSWVVRGVAMGWLVDGAELSVVL